ncbi:MAG: outer membrane lipoprotein-sorting protein [Parashewanella sp.]
MSFNHLLKLFFVSFLLSFSLNNHAETQQALTANTIIRLSNLAHYYAGNDGRAEARMKIIDSQGRQQIRQFSILRKDQSQGGDQDMLVHFSRPSDIKNTMFRVSKHLQSQDDRWLYLPSLDLVKRISAGDKRTSFVGSDFYYEDISGRNPTADSHKLVDITDNTYVVNSTAKSPNTVEFSHYRTTIDQQTLLPITVEYYDNNKRLYRKMTVLKTRKVQQHHVITHAKMENFSSNSKTFMQVRGIKFELGLPQHIFSEKSLRNPPVSWLRRK